MYELEPEIIVAATENWKVPVSVGAPDMAPVVGFNVTPAGRLPDEIEYTTVCPACGCQFMFCGELSGPSGTADTD